MEESKFFVFQLKVRKTEFSMKLAYHKVYFSAAWCERSLLYEQTIEDINIFSPAFLLSWGGWLNWPHSPLSVLLNYLRLKCKVFDNVNSLVTRHQYPQNDKCRPSCLQRELDTSTPFIAQQNLGWCKRYVQYIVNKVVEIIPRRYKRWSYNNSFPFEPCSMPPLKNMLPMCSSGSSLQIGKQYISAWLHNY